MGQRLEQLFFAVSQPDGRGIRRCQVEHFPTRPPMRLQRLSVAIGTKVPRRPLREEVTHKRTDYTGFHGRFFSSRVSPDSRILVKHLNPSACPAQRPGGSAFLLACGIIPRSLNRWRTKHEETAIRWSLISDGAANAGNG